MPGWTNDNLEELIRSKEGLVPESAPGKQQWHEYLLALSDEESVELARLTITNLAYRHAGFYDSPAQLVSLEGIQFSLARVLDLIKESVVNE